MINLTIARGRVRPSLSIGHTAFTKKRGFPFSRVSAIICAVFSRRLFCLPAPVSGVFFVIREAVMEKRLAIIAIIVYSKDATERINALLHEYGEFIIGRMGLPYKERKVSVISVVIDAPEAEIGALAGKLGMIKEVSVKTVYSKI